MQGANMSETWYTFLLEDQYTRCGGHKMFNSYCTKWGKSLACCYHRRGIFGADGFEKLILSKTLLWFPKGSLIAPSQDICEIYAIFTEGHNKSSVGASYILNSYSQCMRYLKEIY